MPPVQYFSPHPTLSPARARGCYTCTHFYGRLIATHVVCEREGGIKVIGAARMGCAFWQREPGADDQ